MISRHGTRSPARRAPCRRSRSTRPRRCLRARVGDHHHHRLVPPMRAWLTPPYGRRHKAPPPPCAFTNNHYYFIMLCRPSSRQGGGTAFGGGRNERAPSPFFTELRHQWCTVRNALQLQVRNWSVVTIEGTAIMVVRHPRNNSASSSLRYLGAKRIGAIGVGRPWHQFPRTIGCPAFAVRQPIMPAGGGAVAPPAQATQAEQASPAAPAAAPAAPAAPAPARPLPTQQATLNTMFRAPPPQRRAGSLDPAAVAVLRNDDAELWRTAAAAAHVLATKKPAGSPKKGAKSLGWLDGEQTKAATKTSAV